MLRAALSLLLAYTPLSFVRVPSSRVQVESSVARPAEFLARWFVMLLPSAHVLAEELGGVSSPSK